MPSIYLSPSVQEYNQYITGNSEEYYMNLVADAMVPYLRSCGISFTRNSPNMTLSQVIAQSNAGNYDLHLALHSNAAPPNLQGMLKGPDIYYYKTSERGRSIAEIIGFNLKDIYPEPDLVAIIPNTTLAELRRTKAPACLVEIAYHDNDDDAQWIISNIGVIARTLVLSLTEYFGIPFIEPA